MNLFKYMLPLVVMAGFSSGLAYGADHGDHSFHDEELNERDTDALRQFINTKRIENAEEGGGTSKNLTITGDVRTEWRHLNEKLEGERLRGRGGELNKNCVPISRNDFDIEFNLRFDYVTERTWAVAHLQYDNSAGIEDDADCDCDVIDCSREPCVGSSKSGESHCTEHRFFGSGACDDICLKRAYMGYNVFKDCGRLDVELGRRVLYDAFESEIQFLSRFDGLLLKYSDNWENVSDWYIQAAGFVVDEKVNHFAWATEIGFFNICDSSFDFKYSLIDWMKRGEDRCFHENPREFKYLNSQFTLTYHFNKETFCVPAEIYGAFLINHFGKQPHVSGHRENLGWYLGMTFGKVVKEGDWSFDVQYQWVEPNAIAWDDESGIGLGDVLEGKCGYDPQPGYHGWRVDALYALTDDLTIQAILESARALHGRRHTYSKMEVEAVYAF
jgi:hypothetical protein